MCRAAMRRPSVVPTSHRTPGHRPLVPGVAVIALIRVESGSMHEAGPDVRARTSRRYPLHYAADMGQVEVINFLIGKGADVNVSTPSYSLPPESLLAPFPRRIEAG